MAEKEKEDDGARADGRGESAAGGGRLARRARGATWRANPESGVVGAEEEEEGEGHGSRAALARGLSMAGCRLPSPLAKEGEGSGSLEEGLSLSLPSFGLAVCGSWARGLSSRYFMGRASFTRHGNAHVCR